MTTSIQTPISVTGDITSTGTLKLSSGATIKLGSSLDTDIYRLGANSLATDGLFTAFGGMNAGSNKITGGANGTASTDFATFGQLPADWINVVTYGADPTGTSDSSSAFNSALAALPAAGGTIYVPRGTYKITSGISYTLGNNQTVVLRGSGTQSTILSYHGTGDCIRMYNNLAAGSGGATSYFSGIYDMTIDGTSGSGTSYVGIHTGDITFLQIQNVIVQNFTGTSSIGVHFDNTVTFTEEGDFRFTVSNCTQGVVLEVTTGFNSYGYNNFDITVFQAGAQSCFVLKNGAILYHSVLRMRGDVNGSATTLSGSPAVIVATGLGPVGSQSSGSNSAIFASHLDIMIEPNNLSGTATHFMQTFNLDTTNFGFITECYGILDFSQGTGSFAPISTSMMAGNGNNFTSFSGVVVGDSNLNPNGSAGWQIIGTGSIINYLPNFTTFDGFFPTLFADAFFTTLDGSNSTVALNYSGVGNGNTLAGPQRKIMFIQQPASGGPFPLVWPTNASPTTSSPTVNWAGGAPPTLQSVASGVDVVELLTFDGATWYGTHRASYGSATAKNVSLVPQKQRITLSTAFTSGTGTTAQTVTGLAAVLQTGTYKLTGWFPMAAAGTTGSTQTLAWTFGGTASSAWAKWIITGATSSTTSAGNSITTASSASPTMTSTGLVGEFSGQIVVTASGTLQLTIKSTTSGDEATIPVGAYLDIEPLL